MFALGTEKVLLQRSRYFHAVSHWKDFAEIIEFFALTHHRRETFVLFCLATGVQGSFGLRYALSF